jgi:preprotein translocase subunit SecF
MASRPPRPSRPAKTTKPGTRATKAAPTKAAATKPVKDPEDTVAVELAEASEATSETSLEETSEATEEVTDCHTTKLPHHSFLARLYTGTGAFEVVGRRKLWYGVSGAIVAIAILSILIRGFTFGIDFKGGTTVSFPRGDAQVTQVQEVFNKAVGKDPEAVVIVANGAAAAVQIRSETLTNDQTAKLRTALFDAFQPKGSDGKPSKAAISDSAVSETWGDQITKKALIALAVFLVLVGVYIMVRYERYMAISALITMVFDLSVTAGVYSLVGFEVTPATVIGLLTILGFSLYDTVIVFDKVEENTRGFQHTTRRSFAEQANLAINQTFMRSINTSLIGVLPVLALMVVAVWLLGVGTLKDLALVQLVGILVGTYSSIFFATPLLVTLRERTDLVRSHTRRVDRRRSPAARSADAAAAEAPAAKTVEKTAEKSDEPTESSGDDATQEITQAAATQAAPTQEAPSKPGPGARPVRPTGTRRPTGKRNAGRR